MREYSQLSTSYQIHFHNVCIVFKNMKYDYGVKMLKYGIFIFPSI